jgi:hypothetical protein
MERRLIKGDASLSFQDFLHGSSSGLSQDLTCICPKAPCPRIVDSVHRIIVDVLLKTAMVVFMQVIGFEFVIRKI